MGQFNIIKMPILSILIYKFYVIPINILAPFIKELKNVF